MKGKSWLIIFFFLLLLIGCSHKAKISLSGDEPVDIREFIKSFDTVELPYAVADTSVIKKPGDSVVIHQKLLRQFVPDTALFRIISTDEKARLYPLCRVEGANGASYLFLKLLSQSAGQRSIILLCFDKKNQFVAGMPVLVPDTNPATQQLFSIDKRFTLSKSISRKNADGTTSDGKNVYVLNEPAKSFLLIMTDALDEQKVELINPIESFPRKTKFSADYVKDKWNLVSIRDGKKPGRINFFVHFERKNNCAGELRGEAGFTSPSTAIYRAGGDFCVLQFNFTAASVSIKEMEGCGSHRGVDCVFEGSFPKKKEIKKKEPKKSLKKSAH